RPITELLHDRARLGAVFLDIGAVTGQGLQYLGWHAPAARRRRHHRSTDPAFAIAEDVDKGLAVESERHRAAQFGIVEGRFVAIDQKLAWDVPRHRLAHRVWRLQFELLHDRQ